MDSLSPGRALDPVLRLGATSVQNPPETVHPPSGVKLRVRASGICGWSRGAPEEGEKALEVSDHPSSLCVGAVGEGWLGGRGEEVVGWQGLLVVCSAPAAKSYWVLYIPP